MLINIMFYERVYHAPADWWSAPGPYHQSTKLNTFFTGDISAEELFNMFFGGAFPSGKYIASFINSRM